MVYYCWVQGLLILDNYMVMLYCLCLRVLNRILSTGHFYNLVLVTSSLSVFCLCRYFLYFFIAGDAGSSSNITSFNTSVICSVDFAGRTSYMVSTQSNVMTSTSNNSLSGVQRFFQEFRLPDYTLDSFSGRLLDVVSSTTFSSGDVQVELHHAITRLMVFVFLYCKF